MWRIYLYWRGQDLGQFWAELNVGNAKVKKTTANEIVTNGNAMYTIAGATFGIFSDQNCSNQIGTLTTNENGETNEVEVTAGMFTSKSFLHRRDISWIRQYTV